MNGIPFLIDNIRIPGLTPNEIVLKYIQPVATTITKFSIVDSR